MMIRDTELQNTTAPAINYSTCYALPLLTHGSLFSGVGGFEEGAERAGIKTLWNCEFENFQRNILKQHYKDNEQFTDVRTANISTKVDIISGGFPCQDISVAGKMEGIKGERSGLWSEMFRIVRNIRPGYVIIENSPALLIRGFERVLCDLSEIGQSEVIRNGNGFQSWTHRVGSIGNAVNPTIAHYLFECIKRHAAASYGCA